jgi:hypothetical protein
MQGIGFFSHRRDPGPAIWEILPGDYVIHLKLRKSLISKNFTVETIMKL